jgi:hypothetical protein
MQFAHEELRHRFGKLRMAPDMAGHLQARQRIEPDLDIAERFEHAADRLHPCGIAQRVPCGRATVRSAPWSSTIRRPSRAVGDIGRAFGHAVDQIGKQHEVERLGKAQGIDTIDRRMGAHRHHRRGERTNLLCTVASQDIFDKVATACKFDGCGMLHYATFRSSIVAGPCLC